MVKLSFTVHRDTEALVDFYVEVLDFQPPESDPATGYAVVRPDGSEIVVRIDDIQADYDGVLASCWPLADPLQDRLWGLRDFRLFDPSGQYLRITSTASTQSMSSHA